MTKQRRHVVFLIPGFFGFANVGGIRYFHHVEELLERLFEHHGAVVRVVPVPTLPTSSIRRRAVRLAEAMERARMAPDEVAHLVGHSTGGLDARLLVTPGVSLGRGDAVLARSVATVTTIATPHYGTPIAKFFSSVAGAQLLAGLSILVFAGMSGGGGQSLAWLGRLVAAIAKLDDFLGLDDTLLDYVSEGLLRDLTPERRQEVQRFFHELRKDQGALVQLTPEGMDLFNAAVVDAPEIRYTSYLTAAPRPSVRMYTETFRDPYFPMSYSLFGSLHALAGRHNRHYPYGEWSAPLREAMGRLLGITPTERDSDGVVPTLSQGWGTVAGLVKGDHLDVCGHFSGSHGTTRHTDWLKSGSMFGYESFEALYQHLVASLLERPVPPRRTDGFVPLGGA